jgi:hypothetical protein
MIRIIAVLLIALGLVGLIWGGISWTQREQVVDFGPLEVTQEERETIPVPPVVGGVLLVAGVLLLIGSRRVA